jgi:vitamin B12 transporter
VNQYTDDRDLTLGFSADRRITAAVALTAEGWVHRLDSRFRDAQDDGADTTGFGFAGTRDAIQWRRGAGVRADWLAGSRATLTVGAALERESESQHSVTASDFGFGRDEAVDDFAERRTTRSGYAQLLAHPHQALEVQVGARLDHNSAFGGFGTWRAGAVWHPSRAWRTWAAIGTGFKAPTFSELFAASAFEVGNPELLPERTRSAEFGLAVELGRASFGLTGFDQRFLDLIQYVGAAPGEPTYGNLGAARARGIEATATVRVTAHVAVRGHWTWLSTQVTDSGATSSVAFRQGSRLLRRPATSGGGSLLVDIAGAHVAGTVTWVGERDDADFRDFPATRTTLPSYATVDLALEAPPLRAAHGPGVVLVARAENLFDARWDQVVGFPGRGRTLFAGGRLAF